MLGSLAAMIGGGVTGGSLLSAGTSLAGGIMGMLGQQNTNAQNTQNMVQNEQWQEMMSDTAMQRRVTDLKAAGLNPLLAVSTQGATTGTPVMPQINNPMALAGQGVQSAGQAAMQGVQQANVASSTNVNNAQALKLAADTANAQGTGALGQVQIENILTDTGLKNATIANLRQQVQESISRVGLNTAQANLALTQIDNATQATAGISADSQIKELDLQQQQLLFNSLVSAAKAQQAAAGSSAQAQNAFNNSLWGRIFHAAVGSSSPSSVVGAATSLIK